MTHQPEIIELQNPSDRNIWSYVAAGTIGLAILKTQITDHVSGSSNISEDPAMVPVEMATDVAAELAVQAGSGLAFMASLGYLSYRGVQKGISRIRSEV